MATSTASLLREFLVRRVLRPSIAIQDEYVRLLLAGPPLAVLRDLSVTLTGGGGSAWRIADREIPVFLVTRNPQTTGGDHSQECNWDFALAVRNSFNSFVLLVDPSVWDERTYSITNATDTVGTPLPPLSRRTASLRKWSPFYGELLEMAAGGIGHPADDLEVAVREALQDLPHLEPEDQHILPWDLLERILRLGNAGTPVSSKELAAECGLPPSTKELADFRRSKGTLKRLAGLLEDAGIEAGIQELQGTSRGEQLGQELSALEAHVRSSAGSASAFARASSFHYVVPYPRPSWWEALTTEALDEMLTEAGRVPQPERLSVTCLNVMNPSPARGEPYMVQAGPSLEARHPQGTFQSPRFERRIGRQRPVVLASSGPCPSPLSFDDVSPPQHSAPLVYTVEDTATVPASMQVVALATYGPGGFVTCLGPTVRKITAPRRSRSSDPWQQQLLLRSGGGKTLRVFCAPEVSTVRRVEPQVDRPVLDGLAELGVDIEEDVDLTLSLLDSQGQSISEITLSVAVEIEDQDTALSCFDALVRAHQDIRTDPPVARAKECWLRRLESELVATDSSWTPVLASPGWVDSVPHLASSRTLGSTTPQVDPRATVDPSPAFLGIRERVVTWLRSQSAPLPEVSLLGQEVRETAAEYLQAYREWAENAPAQACWADTVAILEREPGHYGGQAFAAHEPIAVLLSPLHPVRFAWHVAAQQMLSEALVAPCPVAGLLDPHKCPDVLALALARSGGEPRWKSYVAISCQDSLWGLFWDASRLREMQQHDSVLDLAQAGVVPRGIQSGFTASQARRTLEEMTRVLPTRAVLRLGIVSSGQGSTSCTDGLIAWCQAQYSSENDSFLGPRLVEVYDSRISGLRPSREEVSSLADDTGHRVRWFSGPRTTQGKDLVIIDHLGLAGPVNEVHPWRSPTSEGSLVRSRIRLDRNNAEWVVESRTGEIVQSEDSLLDELGQTVAVLEQLASGRASCSHVAFTPNREVLSRELQDTRFLAVSSAEIDPACFARGISQSGGFLWDYELPHAMGPGEQRGGFYLLAKPPEAIKRTVLTAIRLVSQSSIDIEELLVETSRRGIPILKRLSAGGSLARGELGMLLAVRLLQDAFRGQGRRARLPVTGGDVVRMVLPVDPWVSPLEELRKGLRRANPSLTESTRPDLLLACIRTDPGNGSLVHLVPVEVKFREGVMSSQEKGSSLTQSSSLGDLLHSLVRATPLNDLWRVCGRGFLGEIIDYGFRVYGDPQVNGKPPDEWVRIHRACLADILSGRATVTIAQEGRLLVFDESPYSYADDVDRDGFAETLVVSREDSRALLEDSVQLSEMVDRVADLLDICGPASPTASATTSGDASTGVATDVPTLETTSVPAAGTHAPPAIPGGVGPSVPPHVREHVTTVFSGFIGNRAAVDTLKRSILKAMLSTPPQLPASYLFTGNPSTGKTELARRVARGLGLPFVSLDGRGLGSREKLFELIDGALRDTGQQAARVGIQYQKPVLEYPPIVIFIDEIHLVPRSVQESFLTALEPKDRSLLLSDRVARLPQATFLFATTRPSDVDMAFRTRCTEIPLQDYTEEEVATIVGLEHTEWPDPLRRKIARYGRFVPRIALELARELANEALVSEYQERSLDEHLEEVRRTRLLDENGLGLADLEYLELLEREGRPLGERNVLTMLTNIDKDRFLEEVEPLLVARMKLVRRTEKGREITDEGRRYLIALRRTRSEYH